MDDQPVPGTSGLQKHSRGEDDLDESIANDAAISQLLQQDLLEEEAKARKGIIDDELPDEEPDEYDVEDIRAKRKNTKTGMLEYLVKWANYPESQNTWEPIDNLKCPELIARFNEAEKNKRKRRSTNEPQTQTPGQQKRPRTKVTSNQSQSMVAGDAVINANQIKQQQSTHRTSTSDKLENHEVPEVETPQQKQHQNDEHLLLEDYEQDAASTETLSSNGSCTGQPKGKNGHDQVDDHQARNFLLKGFDRHLPIERIVGSCMDDENKLWFFVKWKEMAELELVEAKELEEKAPRDLCTWYRERLYYTVDNHQTSQEEGDIQKSTRPRTTNSTTTTNVSS